MSDLTRAGDSADEGFEHGGAVEDRISCPTFVCSAEDDDLSADGGKLYDALACPKRYYRFPSAEGAGQHCESGARTLFHSRAFDWLG
jgi:hypothetical protein